MAEDNEDKLSTATSRARWATLSSPSVSDLVSNFSATERPSAATRYVERMRRKREQHGAVTWVAGATPTLVRTTTLVRIVVAMLVLERARDEAEKVARYLRDKKKVSDLVEEEARLKERLVETIRRREDLEEAMRTGTTPPLRQRPKTLALELLANSDEYDVCVECGFFDLASSVPSARCPGCGAVASGASEHEDG